MKTLLLAAALIVAPVAVHAVEPRELLLDIPAEGKLKTSVQKTVRRAQGAQTIEIVTAYDIIDTYACAGESCTVRSAIPLVTLKSFNGQVPPPGADVSAITGAMKLMDGVSYTADASFMPEKLNGLTELKTNYLSVMMAEHGGQIDEATRKSPEYKARTIEAVDSVLTAMGGEDAVSAFAPERGLLSWPHNSSLTLNEPVSQALAFASPIDGSAIEAVLTMGLQSWDDAKKTAVITFEMRPDPKAMADHVKKVAPQILASVGGPSASAGDVKDIEIRQVTTCRYDMDTVTGLVRKGICAVEKGVIAAGQNRVTEEHYVMAESLVK